MSFNGSGTFVPPAGQPVVTGTVIQSSTFNTLVADIGNTFNNVLPRDGQASMAGQLKLTDGTSSVPGIAFNSEASSGIYRPSAGMMALVASGVEVMRLNNAGRVMIGSTTDDGANKLQVTGAAKITGPLTVTGGITGNVIGSATSINTIVPVTLGGTGVATLTGLAYGNGTGVFTASTAAQVVNTLGFLPYNSTNPSGYQNATQLAATAANYLPLTGGVLSGNVTFGNNTGLFFRDTSGNSRQTLLYASDDNFYFNMPRGGNLVFPNSSGGASIATLHNSGNFTVAGTLVGNGVTVNGNIAATGNLTTSGQANINGIIYAQSSQNLKLALMTGPTVNGYIASDSSYCFRAINSTNQLYTMNVDNSGNLTVPGNVNSVNLIGSGTIAGAYVTSTGNVNAQGGFTTSGSISNVSASGSGGAISNFNVMYLNGTNAANPQIGLNNINAGSKSIRVGSGNSLEYINSAYSAVIAYLSDAGQFSANVITQSSDETKKKNWQAVPPDFLTKLAAIEKVGMFEWIESKETSLGIGAQSLEKVLPAAVHSDDKGDKTVNYGGAAMVSVVELTKLVFKLEARIAELEGA